MWLQTFGRAVLPLDFSRGLIRQFAPKLPLGVKYLHNDTKQPSTIKQEPESSPDAVKPIPDSSSQNSDVNGQTASEGQGLGLEKGQIGEHTVVVPKLKKPRSEAQRAQITALGKSRSGKRERSPAQIAHIKEVVERQRAAGFPHLRKSSEEQRALGFPNLRAASAVQKAMRDAGIYPNAKWMDEQRAAGWPQLRANREKSRAEGYRGSIEAHHTSLVRDIEAANKRKLAEDPTFEPLPLPDSDSRPRIIIEQGTIPCPEPGCRSKMRNEESMKRHVRRMHSRYSEETPYKCKHNSCNQYYTTQSKADSHFRLIHNRKPCLQCSICDRSLVNRFTLERHMFRMHGIGSPPPGRERVVARTEARR